MNCRICDRHGLAWFSDKGILVAPDNPAGNTGYRCQHSKAWVQHTSAAISARRQS